jgi:hypothetical protein
MGRKVDNEMEENLTKEMKRGLENEAEKIKNEIAIENE